MVTKLVKTLWFAMIRTTTPVTADAFTGVVTMFKPTKKTIYYETWRKAEGNQK